MSHNPFANPKPRAKRPGRRRTGTRVRLYGQDMTALRLEAFRRSGGFCEAQKPRGAVGWLGRCRALITWETMELSHDRHGSNKSDTLETVIASCKECHALRHNPKSVPRKPGRLMSKKEAKENWYAIKCFCGNLKREQTTFCPACLQKLSPQLQVDVHETLGKDYLTAVALCEQELLAKEIV